MDLEMPAMNGVEATRRIKEGQLARRVVILSVHSGPEETERARAAGADSFVTKGAGYEVLLNAILGKDGSTKSFEKGDGS
jgi:DNA-binding NarL/FixJ family response regulator